MVKIALSEADPASLMVEAVMDKNMTSVPLDGPLDIHDARSMISPGIAVGGHVLRL